jgi:hypothetical protein
MSTVLSMTADMAACTFALFPLLPGVPFSEGGLPVSVKAVVAPRA